jgi:hypothetical protein
MNIQTYATIYDQDIFYFSALIIFKDTDTLFSHILLNPGALFYMPPFEHNVSFSIATPLPGQRIRKLNPKDECFDVYK